MISILQVSLKEVINVIFVPNCHPNATLKLALDTNDSLLSMSRQSGSCVVPDIYFSLVPLFLCGVKGETISSTS
jgi:hypothetical protein